MGAATLEFTEWLEQADIPARRLTPEVEALLQAVFRFRQKQGSDYFSTRLLSHFLLHCECGLKVAQIARLLGLSRPAASGHQGLSSRQAIQQAHHRLNGRPYGKLLPRYAGPIAGFLLGHPAASRADLLDFIDSTFGVKVSRIALYKFLKKYGLDHLARPEPPQPQAGSPVPPPQAAAALPPPSPAPTSALRPQSPPGPAAALPPPPSPPQPPQPAGQIVLPGPSLVPVLAPPPAPPFSSGGRRMPAPSC